MSHSSPRLVVVSNRLPVALSRSAGGWRVEPGAGGLVTALAPVLKDRGGKWIGWSGLAGLAEELEGLTELFADYSSKAGYDMHPVCLSEEEVEGYYDGFANEIAWPLFHDLQTRCNFEPAYWRAYLAVSGRFAEVVATNSTPEDFVWVHDYHLVHVGAELRARGLQRNMGFFLHIPFPPPDIFLKLPWRGELLRALMSYDLVGFQTLRDRRNFVQSMTALGPETAISGRGAVVTARFGERRLRLGNCPISIDSVAFARTARKPEVKRHAAEIRAALKDRWLILGGDRLDYTKGIPQRLRALREALRRYPDLRERVNFIQIVVPSRERVEQYSALKNEIEQLVSRINGEFTTPGWVPVHYLFTNLPREDLVAYYLAADVCLVTPLRDGMNLVAKEYCASNVTERGVLVLSEFAGAASQLQRNGVLLVNPHDIEGMAHVINEALRMPVDERRQRMRRLREHVKQFNIFKWVDDFLMAAASKHLRDFPAMESVDFHRPRNVGDAETEDGQAVRKAG